MSKKKMKKKYVTQEDLDKMTPAEVMSIDLNQIEDGFDVSHTNGTVPVLVKLEQQEPKSEAKVPVKEVESSEDNASKSESKSETKSPKEWPKDEDNKGILFLRFFKKDETNGKILTRLKRKVYFPKYPTIDPGWYIATIIEERNNHGIMDVIPMDKVADTLWNPRYIKGIYVHRNHRDNALEIFPAIPKDQLHIQQPTLIHKVKLPELAPTSGNSIGDILEAKRKQAQTDIIS